MSSQEEKLDCFILTRSWRDMSGQLEYVYWAASERGPVRIRITNAEAVCFVDREKLKATGDLGLRPDRQREVDLKSLAGNPVDACYFNQQADLLRYRDIARTRDVPIFESDLKPADRYLMERFITAACTIEGRINNRDGYLEAINPVLRASTVSPGLKVVSVDIETEDLDGALYSIAVSAKDSECVFLVDADAAGDANETLSNGGALVRVPDEVALLNGFYDWFKRYDPDVVVGWNVIAFDLDFLEKRSRKLGLSFDLGRGRERATILNPQGRGDTHVARLPGRAVLDGIDTLRAAFYSFEDFSLESVANELLGRGKLIRAEVDKVAEITRLFLEDKSALAAYNLEDCRLVLEVFEHTNLVDFALERARLTGLAMGRLGGAVAAFDFLYLPRLHRAGFVANDNRPGETSQMSPGGYVLDSQPGLYDNVLLLDFKSLYPSIIRTFRIDPLGLHDPGDDPVPGFLGASFNRERAILPDVIESLWAERESAKAEKNAPMSQAIKIMMNSFYGVLGASGCRFHEARLASSITRRGHEIIQRTKTMLEDENLRVIYGDTDSLFIALGTGPNESECRQQGEALAEKLNRAWTEIIRKEFALTSYLEMEFETHFLKFIMPTIRGTDRGSKKRYAGMVKDKDGVKKLVFRGLETVRTDWTPLARRFQRELYRRVFVGESFEDYIISMVSDMTTGRVDDELVYRKRLRRQVNEYTTNVPPHVQAARKLDRPGRWITYVISLDGPHPTELGPTALNYDHYLDRQLQPIADGILHFLDLSFDEITSNQISMF